MQHGSRASLLGQLLQKGVTVQTQETDIQKAIAELITRGYRDVTEMVKPFYGRDFDYFRVFQKPNGEPLYCRTSHEVLSALEIAHANNETEAERSAPEPSASLLRTLVGNFNHTITS
jgi:hypothetical protein